MELLGPDYHYWGVYLSEHYSIIQLQFSSRVPVESECCEPLEFHCGHDKSGIKFQGNFRVLVGGEGGEWGLDFEQPFGSVVNTIFKVQILSIPVVAF